MNLLSQENLNILEKNLQQSGIIVPELISKAVSSKKVIMICGPTCAGKSEIAINIAMILGSDVVSVDSMQIYKKMNIGTDKYTTARSGPYQYMTDIFEPDHNATAVEFRDICRKIIEEKFFFNKKIPVLAGGSGLYIRAVLDNLEFSAFKKTGINDFNSKNSLDSNKNYLLKGTDNDYKKQIYDELKLFDPDYAKKIGINDSRRALRALEVFKKTGRPFSEFHKKWKERKSVYNTLFIGLYKEKENLNRCIESRVDKMFSAGLLKEVEGLVHSGFRKYNSLKQAVGYKEVISFLDGESTLEECKKTIARNTKRLAKKQMTWFRADTRINWIRADNYDNIMNLINDIIKIIWKDLRNE